MAPGNGMQAGAHQAQQGLVVLDLAHFKRRGHAAGGQLFPGAAQAGGACHPQNHLQVAQASGRFLAVGFECVGCVFVFVMPLAHFEGFGHQKCLRIQLHAVLLLELCKQCPIAANQAGLQQRGLHRHILGRFGQALRHGAHAGANFQARIPATANEALQLGAQLAP
ncbi:MAG: hypothetical protein ACD_23C00356G0004 [uncultured bacterium]|nr:MAG: hypothetical protein ACD_23C00356G0004 [uncultured bacterium]